MSRTLNMISKITNFTFVITVRHIGDLLDDSADVMFHVGIEI